MKPRLKECALAAAMLLAAALLLPLRPASSAWAASPQTTGGQVARPNAPGCPAKCYAVVVGVEKYDRSKITPYAGASGDSARLFGSLFISADFSYRSISLLDGRGQHDASQPTRENILLALARLRGQVPPDGLLIFAFVGHGVESGGRSYLLPVGAAVSNNLRLLEETAIRVDLLKALIRATGAGQVVVLLDTHREEPLWGAKREDHLLTESFRDAWRFGQADGADMKAVTLFASGVGQRSYAGLSGGYFSLALTEAIRGAALQESALPVSLEALSAQVQKDVSLRARMSVSRPQEPFAVAEGRPLKEVALVTPSDRSSDAAASTSSSGAMSGITRANPPIASEVEEKSRRSTDSRDRKSNSNDNRSGGAAASAGVRSRNENARSSSASRPGGRAPRESVMGGIMSRPTAMPTPAGRPTPTPTPRLTPRPRLIPRPRLTPPDYGTPAERAFISEQQWKTIARSSEPEDYRAFVNLYPGTPHAVSARLRYLTLKSMPAVEVERYASIICPENAQVGKRFVFVAQLTKERRVPDQNPPGDALTVTGDDQQTPWEIEVILGADGFTFLNGSNVINVKMSADKDSVPARFDLFPLPINGAAQKLELRVSFWHAGAPLGEFVREVTVTAQPLAETPEVRKENGAQAPETARGRQPNAPKSGLVRSSPSPSPNKGGSGAPPPQGKEEVLLPSKKRAPEASPEVDDRVTFNPSRGGADMTVRLRRAGSGRPGQYSVDIYCPHFRERLLSDVYDKPDDLPLLLSKYYYMVINHPRGAKPAPGAGVLEDAALMRDFGMEMFRRAPQIFKDTFWDLYEGLDDRFVSIMVYYDDDILPWELMRPARDDGSDERDFLGVEFMVSRWHVDKGPRKTWRQSSVLEVNEVHAVAPRYKGGDLVQGQEKELQALSALPGYVLVPGQRTEVEKLFGDLPSGIIHFAGHGVVEETEQRIDEYYIELEDGKMNFERWRGALRNERKNHPLIFFNACSVGATQKVADLVNGWAPAALNAQASGYIGTLWPVSDDGAANFGVSFYQTLLERSKLSFVVVSELMRDTRRLYLTTKDPTFLAYAYFGDPELMLDLGASK